MDDLQPSVNKLYELADMLDRICDADDDVEIAGVMVAKEMTVLTSVGPLATYYSIALQRLAAEFPAQVPFVREALADCDTVRRSDTQAELPMYLERARLHLRELLTAVQAKLPENKVSNEFRTKRGPKLSQSEAADLNTRIKKRARAELLQNSNLTAESLMKLCKAENDDPRGIATYRRMLTEVRKELEQP